MERNCEYYHIITFPEHDPLIRPPKRPLALGREIILIPGFFRLPPTLAVYDVAHSLPRGDVGDVIMEEGRSAFKILTGTPEGKKPLGRPRRRWERQY